MREKLFFVNFQIQQLLNEAFGPRTKEEEELSVKYHSLDTNRIIEESRPSDPDISASRSFEYTPATQRLILCRDLITQQVQQARDELNRLKQDSQEQQTELDAQDRRLRAQGK